MRPRTRIEGQRGSVSVVVAPDGTIRARLIPVEIVSNGHPEVM